MSSAPAMNDTFCFFLSLETTTGSGSIIVTIFCSGFLRMVHASFCVCNFIVVLLNFFIH